ncbi:MAG: hypothetical protein DGJ47_001046 [Rickettsiaceae bacterium]
MNEAHFSDFAINVINDIAEQIENHDPEGKLDIDVNGGILSIISNDGTYIINKQNAAKEIWLSSPISGPFHFSYTDDKWISRKGDNLFEILSNELKVTIS